MMGFLLNIEKFYQDKLNFFIDQIIIYRLIREGCYD